MAKHKALIVIGVGPGGYAAAFRAADLGIKTTLIDLEAHPGGVCLYRGCIPSKALLHAVDVKQQAMQASDFGISFEAPKIDPVKLKVWKDGIVKKMTGGLGQLAQSRKLEYIQGKASFKGKNTVLVATDDGEEELSFDHAIIATGSSPKAVPGVEPASDHIMYSAQALDTDRLPKSLLVVGAGYIGLELGSVYARLGTEVLVVEMGDDFLPGVDRDLVKVFKKKNEGLYKDLKFGYKVTAIEEGQGLTVTLEHQEGEEQTLEVEKVLVVIGRTANTKGLGLDDIGVKTNEQGFIAVDERQQTTIPSVYAIGDVARQPMLAHKASYEGKVAAEAIAGKATAYEPRAVPAVVYTDPELAWCGLTEAEAQEQELDYQVTRFPWTASGRALTLHDTNGITKCIVDKETRRILGVAVAGKHAGDLIAEAVLAVEMAATVDDLGWSIHPHPTLWETLMEAAEIFDGLATHVHRPRRR